MTVIVAARTGGHVTIAADSQTTDTGRAYYGAFQKVWTDGDWAFGAAGSLRLIQVIKHHTQWPRLRFDECDDLEGFLVRDMVTAIRAAVRDNYDGDTDFELVVANGQLLASIDGNGCVFIDRTGRTCAGSGALEALGHLGTGPYTRARIIQAVRFASALNIGCSGPIHVLDTRTMRVREVQA